MNVFAKKLCIWTLSLAALHGCASRVARTTLECGDSDTQLQRLWNALQEARAAGGDCRTADGTPCERVRSEIERLSFVCPGHAPALLANAILAYDDRQIARAQQLLDELLGRGGLQPDAAALRSRIALDEGNLPYALRFLDQQTQLNPDHAGLREVFAAALFLDARYDDAGRQLQAASSLGAPQWRVAYHLGLIAEARGQKTEAQQFYEEAIRLRPDWAQARSRLNGLRVSDANPQSLNGPVD